MPSIPTSRWLAFWLGASVGFVAGSASAQIPLGPQIRVDTLGARAGSFYDQAREVTLTPDGDFVVTWPTFDTPDAIWPLDIAARRFSPDGRAKAPDFIVNSFRRQMQKNASIASDAAGNFLIVWAGDTTPGGVQGVSGQRFDSAGTPVGAQFRVDSGTTATRPMIAMRPSGEFAVAWNDGEVRARLYDASGAPVSSEFQVNTTSVISQNTTPSIDFGPAGDFVVAWDTSYRRVKARRFAAGGSPLGPEFDVESGTGNAVRPRVARAGNGSFVVAWLRPLNSVGAQMFDPNGAPIGGEFTVGPMNGSGPQTVLDIDADADGDFVVVWDSAYTIQGRRFDSSGNPGPQFQPGGTAHVHLQPSVSSDAAGNFVVTWRFPWAPERSILARRYAAGLSPAALSVDPAGSPTSDGNGVFEAGERVAVAPSWLNANFAAETFTGSVALFTGPGAAGDPAYVVGDGSATYGSVGSGRTGSCASMPDCYALEITVPSSRPAAHWDASFREAIAPANLGAQKTWLLHVGDSFTDVPRSNPFYRFVETLVHHDVTGGCVPGAYCPSSPATRAQMAVFVLVGKEGRGIWPPACNAPMFPDVPPADPLCPWIEELARRGVVSGCGRGNFCPAAPVSREQMAVFVLRTAEPALTPPPCAPPNLFADVPETSGFCRWIEELARRGVVSGCGGGNYCPTAAVSREEMAVFIARGFDLHLYGP